MFLLVFANKVSFSLLHFLFFQTTNREFLIRVSYMEIYNEDINDLFAVENQKLQIHESLDVSYVQYIIYFHNSVLMSKKA